MFSVKPNFSMRLQSIPKINQHLWLVFHSQKWKDKSERKGTKKALLANWQIKLTMKTNASKATKTRSAETKIIDFLLCQMLQNLIAEGPAFR